MHLPMTSPCPGGRPSCPGETCRYALPNGCVLVEADKGGLSLEAIAEVTGIEYGRVRQIEARAMRKLIVAWVAIDPYALEEGRDRW